MPVSATNLCGEVWHDSDETDMVSPDSRHRHCFIRRAHMPGHIFVMFTIIALRTSEEWVLRQKTITTERVSFGVVPNRYPRCCRSCLQNRQYGELAHEYAAAIHVTYRKKPFLISTHQQGYHDKAKRHQDSVSPHMPSFVHAASFT